MDTETIKKFLVGLAFDVDESSLSKFNKSILSATLRVTALYASIKVATSAIVFGITKISQSFEEMGYQFRIIAPAINRAIILRNETMKAYRAAGVNLLEVTKNAYKLNLSIAKTKIAFEAIYRSAGARFFTLITKQSDLFRKKLYENMPKIIGIIEKVVKFIFKAFESTVILGQRLWSILSRVFGFILGGLEDLHKATDGWSTVILGVIAAWKLLNLSFLASPLGAVIAGIVALLALYDDFKTAQEGGKSLFNWKELAPEVEAFKDAIGGLVKMVESLLNAVGNVFGLFMNLIHLDFSGVKESLKGIVNAFGGIFSGLVQNVSGTSGLLGGIVSRISNGNTGNLIQNLQSNPVASNGVAPVGSGVVNNSHSNQNVHQQTNINITGSADANAVGKSVAGEQNRVNFDMVRNLKGATR